MSVYGATTYHLYVTNLSLKAQYSTSMLDASFLCSFFSYLSLHATLAFSVLKSPKRLRQKTPLSLSHSFLVSGVCQCPLSTLWLHSLQPGPFLELLSTSFLPREVPQTLSFLNITLSEKLIEGFFLSNFSLTLRNV